jgi:hypothetical protein
MELAGLEPATSWVRSYPEGKRADTGGKEAPVWSQLSLFGGPANDGRSQANVPSWFPAVRGDCSQDRVRREAGSAVEASRDE